MTETNINSNKIEATPESQKGSSNFRRLLASIRIWDAYYAVVAICYVLTVFMASMRPGVVASSLLILIGICAILSSLRTIRLSGNCVGASKNNLGTSANSIGTGDALKIFCKKLNLCDAFMAAFVIYNVISVIWIKLSGMPLYVYTGELATFIFPAVFYIVGRMNNTAKGFYTGFLTGLFIICYVGLIFYITAPQIYLDYLYEWSYISLADVSTMRVRMNSVCGSTILGAISAAGMLAGAAVFSFGIKKINGGKSDATGTGVKNNKFQIFFGIFGFLTGFVFAVLSNQRSAMVVAILIAVYINCLVFLTFKLFKKKYFYIECGAIIVLVVALAVVAPGILMKVYYRLESLPQAIGERSEQWVAAVNMMFSSWIGNGLGANGHRALGIEGVKVIADGGLVKMFCENGVVGFSLFTYLMILLYKKGLKHFADCFAEIGIISIFILQSVGSNVLSFQLVTPIFWFAVGKLASLNLATEDAGNSSATEDAGNSLAKEDAGNSSAKKDASPILVEEDAK